MFRTGIRIYFFSTLLLCITSCATGKLIVKDTSQASPSQVQSVPLYTIYAIGDAGEWNPQMEGVIQGLKSVIEHDPQTGTILFLGDNIYPAGLAPETDEQEHADGEAILTYQIKTAGAKGDNLIFIPGNHDWNEFKPGGLDAIRRQGDFISDYPGTEVKMYPEGGCSGPVTLEFGTSLVILILDSQWWIQDWEKEPNMNAGCALQSRDALVQKVGELFRAYADRQVIVAMHHPIRTQGPHGGHFTLRDHLFPLTKVVPWLYIPLPVIGSIYPWYRTVIGHPQDLKHPRYKSLQESLLEAAGQRKNIVFLSGHDHNLQYLHADGQHFIVSGAGSKQNAVANAPDLIYGHKAGGFVQLDYFENRSVRLTVYELDKLSGAMKPVFTRFIIE